MDKPQTILQNRSDKGRMPENLSSWWASSPSAPKRHGTITVWLFWGETRGTETGWNDSFAAQRSVHAYVRFAGFSIYNQIASCCAPYKMYKRHTVLTVNLCKWDLTYLYMSLQCIVTSWKKIFDSSFLKSNDLRWKILKCKVSQLLWESVRQGSSILGWCM